MIEKTIGVLMKEKKKDNQYKLKKAMAIAIGLKVPKSHRMCVWGGGGPTSL